MILRRLTTKRRLAHWLRYFPPLRWGLVLGVRLFAPRQTVGVSASIFNEAGQVLLVEHVFRPYYPWGLPGGWIERGEDPAKAVQRELQEELQLQVAVKRLLLCQPQGCRTGVPPGLGLAYYCRLVDGQSALERVAQAPARYEILALEWADPDTINHRLTPLDRQAVALGKREFDREQLAEKGKQVKNYD